MARERKYRAYSQVEMTDGIRTWLEPQFDMDQQFTPDDWQAFQEMQESGSPENRIRAMYANLATLAKSTDPAIRMHVAAIRAIYKRSRADPDLLREADRLWRKIMVLRDVIPKALMGAKHSKAQSNRRADKPAENEHDPDRNQRLRQHHARLKRDHRDATALTAAAFNLSERQVRRILAR